MEKIGDEIEWSEIVEEMALTPLQLKERAHAVFGWQGPFSPPPPSPPPPPPRPLPRRLPPGKRFA
eukprot:1138851-Pyramimonas_sp.AAC.1